MSPMIVVCKCPGMRDFAETAFQVLNQVEELAIPRIPKIQRIDKMPFHEMPLPSCVSNRLKRFFAYGTKFADLYIFDPEYPSEAPRLLRAFDLLHGKELRNENGKLYEQGIEDIYL